MRGWRRRRLWREPGSRSARARRGAQVGPGDEIVRAVEDDCGVVLVFRAGVAGRGPADPFPAIASPARAHASTPTSAYLISSPPLDCALVPDSDVSVERVALHRGLTERLDRAHEVVRGRAVRRPRRRDDVLLDHHRAEIVGAEAERN